MYKRAFDTVGRVNYPQNRQYDQPFSALVAAGTVMSDPTLTPVQKALGMQIVADAAKETGFYFTTPDLVRAGIGAGMGYGAAYVTGKAMGAVFGMSPDAQKSMSRLGALGGLLRATGVWQ